MKQEKITRINLETTPLEIQVDFIIKKSHKEIEDGRTIEVLDDVELIAISLVNKKKEVKE